MSDRILTVGDVIALDTVMRFAQHSENIKWTDDEGETIRYGMARSVGREDFTFLNKGDDVRDSFLRVTGRTGTEYALPMADCMKWVGTGAMAVDKEAGR